MILSDIDIKARVYGKGKCGQMGGLKIRPFVDWKETGVHASYGLSHAGYDLRLRNGVKLFKTKWLREWYNLWGLLPLQVVADIGDFDREMLMDAYYSEEKRAYRIPPGASGLATAYEYLEMPHDLMGTVFNKSTYARVGLVVHVTPIEPGWRGYLTIEFTNTSPFHVWLYPNQGIAQVMFHQLTGEVVTPYNGKYQDQINEIAVARGAR